MAINQAATPAGIVARELEKKREQHYIGSVWRLVVML